MDFICRRCNHLTKEKLFRVTTEDAGVVVLNMLVCSPCARLATELGLPTVEVESGRTDKVRRESVMPDMPPQTIQV